MIQKNNCFKAKKLVLSVTSALAILMANGTLADSQKKIDLNIKSQSAGNALLELARNASVQIMVPNVIGESVQLRKIQGKYTLTTALDEILLGSGLTYEFRSDDSIIIKRITTDKDRNDGESKDEADEEIVVTGSAIRGVNPTSVVTTITSAEIDRLGLSSAEDILRALPQNFSDHNGAVTLGGGGTEEISAELGLRQDGIGTSAANLRGLGNDATLILINGHRTAQSPLFENNGINLATIPAIAIERVEVVLDGASARYGSDAVAGVINFILKDDYNGSESSARYENSITDAHVYRFSQSVGYEWGSGSLVGVLALEERNAPSSRELGFTSRDNTSRGGTDLRNPDIGVNGIVRDFTLSGGGNVILGDIIGALPAGFDGTEAWTEADLSLDNIIPADTIREDQGSTSQNTSVYITVNQDVTDGLSVYLDALYSKSEAEASQVTPSTAFTFGIVPEDIFSYVPASNAFNRLGRDVLVAHSFNNEVNTGLVPPNVGFNTTNRFDVNTGLVWDTLNDWQVKFNLGYSEEKAATFRAGLDTQTGVSQQWVDLIASSDPNEAINLFGAGTVQTPLLGTTYSQLFETNPSSENFGLEIVADGQLFDLNGNEIRGAVGSEYRLERRDYNFDSIRGATDGAFFDPRRSNPAATAEPEREVKAFFVEIDLPLVNENSNVPFVQNLQVNIGARWEEYTIAEAFEPNLEAAGFDFENPPFIAVGPIEDISPVNNATFSQTSPRVGLRWDLVDSFAIRASWGESFRAPSLFDYTGTPAIFFVNLTRFGVDDPIAGERVAVPRLFGGNARLNAETSTNTTFGFDWLPSFAEGMTVQMSYTKIDFEDRIATPFSEFGDEALLLPEVGVRNSNNELVLVNVIPFNLASRTYEGVDFRITYPFSNDWGDFTANLSGTYTATLEDVLFEGEAAINRVNTDRGPSDWRARASLDWSNDNYGASLFFNYTGAFQYELRDRDGDTGQIARTEEYWTVDLTGTYRLPNSGWSFNGGIRNLFHTAPPFFNNRDPNFDTSRVDARGRVMYLEAKKTFDF